eukprot:1138866-Pelagomonas_calceolata.AAC.12
MYPSRHCIARDVSNDNVRVQDAGSGKGKGGLKNEVLHAIGPKPPAACPRRQWLQLLKGSAHSEFKVWVTEAKS